MISFSDKITQDAIGFNFRDMMVECGGHLGFIIHVLLMFVIIDTSMSEVTMVFMCDNDIRDTCRYVMDARLPSQVLVNNVTLNMTGYMTEATGDFQTNLKMFHEFGKHTRLE